MTPSLNFCCCIEEEQASKRCKRVLVGYWALTQLLSKQVFKHWYKKKIKKISKILLFQFFNCLKKIIPYPSTNFFVLISCAIPKKKWKKDQSCTTVIFKKQYPANFSSSLWLRRSPHTNPQHHYWCWIVVQCLQPKPCFGGPFGSLFPLIWPSV